MGGASGFEVEPHDVAIFQKPIDPHRAFEGGGSVAVRCDGQLVTLRQMHRRPNVVGVVVGEPDLLQLRARLAHAVHVAKQPPLLVAIRGPWVHDDELLMAQ